MNFISSYLIVNQRQSNSTGLSNLLEGEISHNKIIRSISSKDLWTSSKTLVKEISSVDAVLYLDATIKEKPI